MSRELALADGMEIFRAKKRKAPSKTPKKRVELNVKAKAALASMDPATRAFLEASM